MAWRLLLSYTSPIWSQCFTAADALDSSLESSSCIPWSLIPYEHDALRDPINKIRATLCSHNWTSSPSALLYEVAKLIADARSVTNRSVNLQAWQEKRSRLTHEVFGASSLPRRSIPDVEIPMPGIGTLLGWTIKSGGLSLNSSVFHFKRAQRQNEEPTPLLLYHQGHDGAAPNSLPEAMHRRRVASGKSDIAQTIRLNVGDEWTLSIPTFCDGDIEIGDENDIYSNLRHVDCDGVIDWAWREFGADVMIFHMPLQGVNMVPGLPASHWYFHEWELRGSQTLRFFLEPVIASINYAQERQGYSHIMMAGLSGGGWVTTLAAALDARISLSIPVAGTLPFDLRWPLQMNADELGDYENHPDRSIYAICDVLCMYALGALEKHRTQLQILHEIDPCCFGAEARHLGILSYTREVSSVIDGYFRTFVLECDLGDGSHFLCEKDKMLIVSLAKFVLGESREPFDMTKFIAPWPDALDDAQFIVNKSMSSGCNGH